MDDALQALAVLRVDENDDVAATDSLREKAAESNAFARLRGADQEGTSFEVLERAIEGLFFGLDAMNVG